MEKDRNVVIDGMRGFAILYVFVLHATQTVFTPYSSLGFKNILLEGTLGVPLFFCLSGFLVYSSFAKTVEVDSRPILYFYLRRILRIFPLWWITVAIYFFSGKISGAVALAYLTFYFGFDFDFNSYQTIYVSWSLFVEEVFYFILPFAFVFLKKIPIVCRYLIVAFAISQIALKTLTHPATNALLYMQYFLIGILIYHGEVSGKLRPAITSFSGPKFIGYIDLITVFIFSLAIWRIWVPRELIVPLLFLAMFYGTGPFNFLAKTRFLNFLGQICFSIYLLHPVVMGYMKPFRDKIFENFGVTHASGELQLLVWLTLTLIPTLVVGYASFHLIEKPFINFGRRNFKFKVLKAHGS